MIKVRLTHTGFRKGERRFKKASKTFDKAVSKALTDFGQDAADWLKERARAGAFGPPKRRGSGPPLIKTGNYINSIKAKKKGRTRVEITPTGQNAHMSNEDLGAILEYGNAGIPARPHWRPLALWIVKKGAKKLGKRIADELLLGGGS